MKFNTKTPTTKTTNLAGGQAYQQSDDLELVSIMLTSFATDSTYRSGDQTIERLKELIGRSKNLLQVAKAAIYARTVFGMRSITHVVASELGKMIGKETWAKDFYKSIVHRPDDMLEILAYHKANNGKIPNSMKKGFAKAFDKFNAYSLGKYRGEGKAFKLIDVVNLVHPVSTEANKEALQGLVTGTLRSEDTWEVELTKAGQSAKNEAEKAQLKAAAWLKLFQEKKIGYFAILRNMRNIIQDAPFAVELACAMLVDENLIRKSLVLPFRYLTAFEEVQKSPASDKVRKVMTAIATAVDISLQNVPAFEGETLVVLDKSGSMNESAMGTKSPHVIGALFASVLVKKNNCDFMAFSDNAAYFNMNTMDSTITMVNSIRFASGGTNFHSIFQTANKKYDRVIILSDMQGWIGHDCPSASFNAYKNKYAADPFIYSFDLKNYGTMQFPEKNVFALAGFSERIFDVMKYMETDKQTLFKVIDEIQL